MDDILLLPSIIKASRQLLRMPELYLSQYQTILPNGKKPLLGRTLISLMAPCSHLKHSNARPHGGVSPPGAEASL